jgi:hypothetical protein
MNKMFLLLPVLIWCSLTFGAELNPPKVTLTPAEESPWLLDVPCLPAEENPETWTEPDDVFANEFPGFPEPSCIPNKEHPWLSDNLDLTAEEIPWLLITNRYFEVLTNATRGKALIIVKNLEKFRVATLQLTNVQIPHDAPRTIVLLFDTYAEFQRYTPDAEILGYTVPLTNRPGLIVMSADGDHRKAMRILRHEYVHVLTAYRSGSYPAWYREGIAEVLAYSEFDSGETSSTNSEKLTFLPPLGRLSDAYKTESFNRLIRDDYDPHKRRKGSDDYAQYWMLVHYVTFNPDMKSQLEDYFQMYNSGVTSQKAFKKTFGMSASKLWRKKLKQYLREVPNYRLSLDVSEVDYEFEIEWADTTEIKRVLNDIEQGARDLEKNRTASSGRKVLADEHNR